MICSDARFVVQPVRSGILPDAGLASIEKMKEGDIVPCLVTLLLHASSLAGAP